MQLTFVHNQGARGFKWPGHCSKALRGLNEPTEFYFRLALMCADIKKTYVSRAVEGFESSDGASATSLIVSITLMENSGRLVCPLSKSSVSSCFSFSVFIGVAAPMQISAALFFLPRVILVIVPFPEYN